MAELSNLALMTPELIVLGGALLLLMWGVFRPETEREAETIGWGAVVVLFVAGFSLVQGVDTARLFEASRRNIDRLTILQRLSTAIAGSLEMDRVVSVVAAGVRELRKEHVNRRLRRQSVSASRMRPPSCSTSTPGETAGGSSSCSRANMAAPHGACSSFYSEFSSLV